jgi:biopolymer transport protein ExbD
MITRPLDLASKLRPEPRNFDFIFFVNAGLLVLFFYFFGSRFVLAPSLGVDFKLAQLPDPGMAQTTHHISVKRDGMIFADNGQISLPQLRTWLDGQKKVTKHPVLLVLLDSDVPVSVSTDIYTVAREAGFEVVQGVDAVPAKPGGGR